MASLSKKLSVLISAISAFAIAETAVAESNDSIGDAVKSGKANITLRYRYERVDQDNLNEDAGASTLKSRFSWKSGQYNKFTVGLEMDYVSVLGSERYNSTENGKTNYPLVADPEGFDLNQSYLKYTGGKTSTTLGRQRITHGSQRFIGGVAWRQNEQTYDGVRIQRKDPGKWTMEYTYTWNVNRIFGPDDGAQPSDWRGDSHFLTSGWSVTDGHHIDAYAYLLEFDNDNGVPNSTNTYGLAYKGKFGPVTLTAAAATQSDAGDSPLSYDADYYQLQADFKISKVTLTAGIEVLGSDDGVAAFRTPLATLHKFQGWADKFLNTPAAGIEDTFVGIKGKLGPVRLAATWHEFSPNEGSGDYGTELNAVATWAIRTNLTVQLKYADYQEDGFSVDTTKYWASLIVKL
ncbi:MAG: hypothetical protein ACI8Z1_002100 [Candidatus Azotimanducaceae bacterium]|jgi:hypothetical protein